MTNEILELVSEAVHNKWIATKKAKGITTRKLDTTGEELLVPYPQLSEEAKDLDRGSVKATLEAIEELGYTLINTNGGASRL